MTVAERTIPYESYQLLSGCRVLVVDAEHVVPNRGAFAREACDREADAVGVLFLAVEAEYAEPRVVATLVTAEGVVDDVSPAAAGCAAEWAVRRLDGGDVLLDTQTGTYRGEVTDEAVRVERLTAERERATVSVERERGGELAFAPPVPATDRSPARRTESRDAATERVVSEQPRRADDD